MAGLDGVLLFLHVPKCGGATLNQIIYRNCRAASSGSDRESLLFSGVCWFPGAGFYKPHDLEVYERIRPVLNRPDLRALVGHFWYGIHQYVQRPWTYATMLRDPVNRVLSLYHHVKQRRFPVQSLDEFIANPPFREVDNDQTRRLAGVEPEIGQCTREMLEMAKDHLNRDFAVVGVTERFEETVVLLGRTLGWTGELAHARGNVSRNRLMDEGLADTTRERILERNALDLELYEYARSLLDGAVAKQPSNFRDAVTELRAANDRLAAYSYVG